MILRVPVTTTLATEWIRRAATAINQLIDAQDALAKGPYSDDAAAATGGVAVGGVYRKTGGTLAWREA